MHALRAILRLGLCLGGCASVSAGTVTLPADVSVSLTAEPDADLQSGQRIAFTISVTNHGPEPAAPVMAGSTPIHDELDVYTATADCDNTLGLAVVDLDDSFYYAYSWFPTLNLPPLEVGETRNCYLSMEFTEWAPDTFALTFAFPDWLVDLDASNNSATVTLQRAAAAPPPVPLPSTSVIGLLLLAAALARSAILRLRELPPR